MDRELQAIKRRFNIIGTSELLDRALSTAVRVAPTDLTVLLMGESGVGKEVFSKVIHSLSPRKHNEFIAVNCGAIPEGTINSELFGHEKGAFTGATSDRKGYFETCNGGTIFLDEIGEMPLDTQAYLLRVLEYGEFMRVGSSKVLKTDVRVVAATNKDLLEQVKKGKFREDLYYRLATVPIRLPALRERPEDIPILARKFAVEFAERYRTEPIRFTPEALELMLQYRWPGNIRELKNVVERLSVLSEKRDITPEDVLRVVPDIGQPESFSLAVPEGEGGGKFDMSEREILYKLLFEMKRDLNALKSLVVELVHKNGLDMPDGTSLPAMPASGDWNDYASAPMTDYSSLLPAARTGQAGGEAVQAQRAYRPVIIADEPGEAEAEVVEETLSLEEMEKEYIKKALKKHNGRRKDAARELGISERTLYRKIKQYNIDA
ncbi:MAG: sigma-54-dependent Fis family transcriptional regulator [Bacteroidetes bacterium]|nr:MAG: sigma-54-dependent Fis family transcriptional regulator [Bacteroidota bacterium]